MHSLVFFRCAAFACERFSLSSEYDKTVPFVTGTTSPLSSTDTGPLQPNWHVVRLTLPGFLSHVRQCFLGRVAVKRVSVASLADPLMIRLLRT